MPFARSPAGWSELLELMTDRFGGLTVQTLDHLRELLDAGRSVINCAESGLLVPTEDGEQLQFLVSVNSQPGVAETLREIRVPCANSIAGYVYNTGQLMAMANPDDFYPEVDRKTGLTTSIYLATPVMDEEGVLGVITFVNRPDGQSQDPFDEVEIEWSTRLADLAAAGLKYYRRLCLQEQFFQAELSQAAERFADTDQRGASIDAFDHDSLHSSPPAARAILALERLAPGDQDLAAELINVLSNYRAERDGL